MSQHSAEAATPEPAMSSSETYLELATFMNRYDGAAIFRRFGDLNMLNLLTLQSELEHLRARCLISRWNNDSVTENHNLSARSIAIQLAQIESGETVAEQELKSKELMGEIRMKLKEYSKYHGMQA